MWKFHGTMLSLKYAMSVFQKRSKLVGCVQSARVNDVINFGQIISGDYYLRLLLDEGGSTKIVKAYATYNTSSMHPLLNITFSLSLLPSHSSAEFFNDLYHRFLLSPKPNMKAMCLQAMAIVYGQCYEEIGPFNDTEFIVRKMALVCTSLQSRFRLDYFHCHP